MAAGATERRGGGIAIPDHPETGTLDHSTLSRGFLSPLSLSLSLSWRSFLCLCLCLRLRAHLCVCLQQPPFWWLSLAFHFSFFAMLKDTAMAVSAKQAFEDGGLGYLFLYELPDDVFGIVSSLMQHTDLCNLSATCRRLRSLCISDKVWRPHCQMLLAGATLNLQAWRKGVESYKMLFQFLYILKPLQGIWVHQNPELGNLVYVTWGFLSVVGCRIIPQELDPRGLERGLLWAPVFEIIVRPDGSLAFFLHGREQERDCCYPGRFIPPKKNCNVLLLEVEALNQTYHQFCSPNSPLLLPSVDTGGDSAGEECSISSNLRRKSSSNAKEGKEIDSISFHELQFGDRRRLLELLAPHIRLQFPPSVSGPLFPRANLGYGLECMVHRDLDLLAARRAFVLWMHSNGEKASFAGTNSQTLLKIVCSPVDITAAPVARAGRCMSDADRGKSTAAPIGKPQFGVIKKHNGISRFISTKMKQIMGRASCQQTPSNISLQESSKKLQLQEFLKQGNQVGLCLHASSWKLTMYHAWPIMHDNRFALYKIPEPKPEENRELAGVWGGTFGWPPGKQSDDRPDKALFVLLLSYEDTEAGLLLIATKILEGSQYVVHPNGSPIFIARVEEPSSEAFGWDRFKDGAPVEIVQAYNGEGIAPGYGFRYPCSKPGDLYVEGNGMLAFVWRDSKAVLTLQRLDLQTLLEKGERVVALAPIANFAYLTKSYNNLFAGYSGNGDSAATRGRLRRTYTYL